MPSLVILVKFTLGIMFSFTKVPSRTEELKPKLDMYVLNTVFSELQNKVLEMRSHFCHWAPSHLLLFI